MRQKIHPNWYPEAKITCACGNSFTIGATFPELKVEICNNCHPFYTGESKLADTRGRGDAFMTKVSKAQSKPVSKTEKRKAKRDKKLQEELARPETLSELRQK